MAAVFLGAKQLKDNEIENKFVSFTKEMACRAVPGGLELLTSTAKSG